MTGEPGAVPPPADAPGAATVVAMVTSGSPPRVLRLVTALSLVLVAALTGCGASSQLQSLRAEPMADLRLDAGERVDVLERDAGEQLGKPQGAVIQLTFRPVAGASVDDVLGQARAAAAEDGWQLDEPSPSDVSIARRSTGSTSTELSIYPTTDGDVVVSLTTR